MLEHLRGNRTLGVFLDEGMLYCAELETLGEGRFRVRDARTEAIAVSPGGSAHAEAAALLERLCRTFGLVSEGIELCLPRDRFFIYERDFPAMPREEFCAAARWDLETNVPFEEGSYWSGFGSHGERTELAAVEAANGRALVEAIVASGLSVAGLTMEPLRFSLHREGTRFRWRDAEITLPPGWARTHWTHGLDMALFAALRRYYPRVGLELLPEGERAQSAWAWRLGGCAMLALTVVAVAVLLVGNLWQLSAAEARLDALRQDREMQGRERELMEELSTARGELEQTEGQLSALSEERLSWYGVMSFLGAARVDGVYLTGFDTQDDGVLVCRGRAMDFEALSAFLGRLETEIPIFKARPALRESEADGSGYIRFALELRFREATS